MDDKLRNLKKFSYLGLPALAIVVFSLSFFSYQRAKNIQNMSTAQDGLSTCFNRVNQSYTAAVTLEGGSPFLKVDFLRNTEECFGELLSLAEENFKVLASGVYQKLNTLSSEVYWLHSKVKGQVGFENDDRTDLGLLRTQSRYYKTEVLKNNIFSSLEEKKSTLLGEMETVQLFFYLVLVAYCLWTLYDFKRSRQHLAQNDTFEAEAEVEIMNDDFISVRVGELIKSSLRHNKLDNCAELFGLYHADLLEGRVNNYIVPTANNNEEEIEDPALEAAKQIRESLRPEKFTRAEEDNEENHFDDDTEDLTGIVSLEEVFSGVTKNLSEKFLKAGILVNLDIENELCVKGTEDEIQQIFYQLILNSIQATEHSKRGRKITVTARSLGGTAHATIQDSGPGFDLDMLDYPIGEYPDSTGVGLFICNDLIKNVKGEIKLSNRIDGEGNILGAEAKVLLRRARLEKTQEQTEKSRLVGLIKGSKADVLNLLKEI